MIKVSTNQSDQFTSIDRLFPVVCTTLSEITAPEGTFARRRGGTIDGTAFEPVPFSIGKMRT